MVRATSAAAQWKEGRRTNHRSSLGPHGVPQAGTARLVRKLKEAAAGRQDRAPSSANKRFADPIHHYVIWAQGRLRRRDAAWIYFSKAADQLTLPEAALIAGLPPPPSVYSPLVKRRPGPTGGEHWCWRMRRRGSYALPEQTEAEATPLGSNRPCPKVLEQ